MDREYKLIKECEHQFEALMQAVKQVIEVYAESPGQAWALHSPRPDVEWLANALLDMWYEDNQDGRATRIYVGLIAANEKLLAVATQANVAKDQFFAAMAAIREAYPSRISNLKYNLAHRPSALNEHLRASGLSRLHLKQCWRHLPMLEQEASRVRMAWYTSGRSIKRLSVAEAERMLCSFNTEEDHIRIQLRLLAGIPSNEPLAQVQEQAPVMRANIFYKEPLPDGRLRRAMNLPLPLFIPSSDGFLPSHNQPPPTPRPTRVRALRNDVKLESEPFLKSIRVYRYKESVAQEGP